MTRLLCMCIFLLLSNNASAALSTFKKCAEANYGDDGYCYGGMHIFAKFQTDTEKHGLFRMFVRNPQRQPTDINGVGLKDKAGFDVFVDTGLFDKDFSLLNRFLFTGDYWSFRLTSLTLDDNNLFNKHKQSISFSGIMQHIKRPASHTKDNMRGGLMDTGSLKITTDPDKFVDKQKKPKIRPHAPHEDVYMYDLTGHIFVSDATKDDMTGEINYEHDETQFSGFTAEVEGRHTINEPMTAPIFLAGFVTLLFCRKRKQKSNLLPN